MRSIASRWSADVLLPVLVAAVEAAAIAPLLSLVGIGVLSIAPADVPWPAALGALGVVAFWSTRLMAGAGLSLRRARPVSVVLWLAATLLWLGIQYRPTSGSADRGPLVLTAALAFVAWWRGLGYGSNPAPFAPERLRRLVRWAWSVLAVSLAAGAVAGDPAGNRALASGRGAVPVVVAGGLLAVAAAQIEQARTTALRQGGRAPERGRWLALSGVAAILIVAAAALVGGLLGHDVWRVVYEPVVTALRLVSLGILYLLLALAFVVFLVVWPLIWLARLAIGKPDGNSNPLQGSSPQDFSRIVDQTQGHFSPEVAFALRAGLVIVVVAVAILFLLSSLRRYRATSRDDARESLWSRDLARRQLRRLVTRRHAARPEREKIDLTREPASVREAYRFLLTLAARSDLGRQPAESASAFSRRLATAWPDVAEPVLDLTERYLRVRYGEEPEEPDSIPARDDWRAIRQESALTPSRVPVSRKDRP
jgi:hypothetical protein